MMSDSENLPAIPSPDKRSRNRRKRRFFLILKLVIFLYCGVGIALYYLQEKFLFHPEPLPQDYQWQFKQPFEEYNIRYSRSENLNIVRFKTTDSLTKGAIIYFHGNVANIARHEAAAKLFTSQHYEVWMVDYPGFGKTTGALTEAKLYDQASQIYKLVKQHFPADSIIIYGRSLGTGIAAQLASFSPCRMLILESPYYSIPDLFASYAPVYPTSRMSKFKVPTWKFVDDCDMPIMIFHGSEDDVIPLSCAAKLKAHLKPIDQFIEIDKGRHNDISAFEVYSTKIDSILLNEK